MPRRLERVGRVAAVVVRRARSWDICGDFILMWSGVEAALLYFPRFGYTKSSWFMNDEIYFFMSS